jgi:hypothetical protein
MLVSYLIMFEWAGLSLDTVAVQKEVTVHGGHPSRWACSRPTLRRWIYSLPSLVAVPRDCLRLLAECLRAPVACPRTLRYKELAGFTVTNAEIDFQR